MSCCWMIVMFFENFFFDLFSLNGNTAFFLSYSVIFFPSMGVLQLFVKDAVLFLRLFDYGV